MERLFLFFWVGFIAQTSLLGQPHQFDTLHTQLSEAFAHQFEFSVIIQKGHQEVYNAQFGFVDEAKERAVDENTVGCIASISKAIAAVGIMKLVKENRLSLDDQLGQFFDQVPKKKKGITIQMLLSHFSGYRHNYKCEGVSNSAKATKILLKEKLANPPGKKFTYTGQNFQLLALIIERVTGKTYEGFIRQSILDPLDMHHTFFWQDIQRGNNLYQTDPSILKLLGQRDWGYIGPTGVFSTPGDLLKFWNAVWSSDILPPALTAKLFDTYYTTSSGLQIGFGFYKRETTKWQTPEVYTRGTESWGHNSVIRHFPEKNITIVVSTNSGEYGKNQMTGNRAVSDWIVNYLFASDSDK